MLDCPDPPHPATVAHGAQVTHAPPAPTTAVFRPGQVADDDVRTTHGRSATTTRRAVRRVLTLLTSGAAAFTGGAVGARELGVPLAGVVVVLIAMLLVAAIPIVGFTYAMVTLVAEGRRKARNAKDVGILMAGAASAYGQVFTQFTALVRGTTARRPDPNAPPLPSCRTDVPESR